MRRVLATMEISVRSKLVLRAALLAAACALAPAPARAGQEMKFSSLLGGAVTFTTPEAWQSPSHQGTDLVGLLQMTALYPVEEGNEPGEERKVVARIWLSARVEDDARSLKEWSDGAYLNSTSHKPHYPDFVMLSDAFHGGEWRTIAYKATHPDGPRVMLDRFGRVGKKWVYLGVTLLTDGSDPKLPRRAVEDFNAMCAGLKIDGENEFNSHVKTDALSKPQKVNPKP